MSVWHGSNKSTAADVQQLAEHFARMRERREARVNAGLECGRCGCKEIERTDAVTALFTCTRCHETWFDLRGCEP